MCLKSILIVSLQGHLLTCACIRQSTLEFHHCTYKTLWKGIKWFWGKNSSCLLGGTCGSFLAVIVICREDSSTITDLLEVTFSFYCFQLHCSHYCCSCYYSTLHCHLHPNCLLFITVFVTVSHEYYTANTIQLCTILYWYLSCSEFYIFITKLHYPQV